MLAVVVINVCWSLVKQWVYKDFNVFMTIEKLDKVTYPCSYIFKIIKLHGLPKKFRRVSDHVSHTHEKFGRD